MSIAQLNKNETLIKKNMKITRSKKKLSLDINRMYAHARAHAHAHAHTHADALLLNSIHYTNVFMTKTDIGYTLDVHLLTFVDIGIAVSFSAILLLC